LYILICGCPPFYGDSETDTICKILDFEYNYDLDIWNVVTPELRDIIDHLLAPQDQRYDAEDALNHPWIKKHELDDAVLSKDLPNQLGRLEKFQKYQTLKKIILTYFCSRLQDSKIIAEADIFAFLDKNNDGVLSIDELKSSTNCESKDLSEIKKAMDADKKDGIYYTEWLTAAKDWSGIIDSNKIREAFNAFDIHSSGKFGWEELRDLLGNEQDENNVSKVWKEVINEVDTNSDGKVDFEEFQKLFESKLVFE